MVGIYIHIPFCAAKCNYCDFNSHVGTQCEQERYIDALCREIECCGGGEMTADTVYFGGGTPTILKPERLLRILTAVKNRFKLDADCEITTECNPGTVGGAELECLRRGGFNRLSIGMQSAEDEQLKALGRIHSFEDCRKCVIAANAAGFDNLSVDLMFGLPNQDSDSWKYSLEQAAELEPSHISAYALKIEEGTPFFEIPADELNIADEELSRDMYDFCNEFLRQCGFRRYEISNFSKNGMESRHNLKYWRCEDYIGFGAGAHSCRDGRRYFNIENTEDYIRSVNECGFAVKASISIYAADKMSEFVYLGLRLVDGISEAEFKARFSANIDEVFGAALKLNLNRGTLIRDEGRIYIPDRYVYVSNAIMSDFV